MSAIQTARRDETVLEGAVLQSGFDDAWTIDLEAARAALWACSLAMKKANLMENRIKDIERSFELGAERRAAA